MLEEALSVLRLRAFTWCGWYPVPLQRMFEALFAASGETLEDIAFLCVHSYYRCCRSNLSPWAHYSASTCYRLDLEPAIHISMLIFTHLKSLSLLNRYGDRCRRLEREDPGFDSVKQTVMEASSSLRSLGAFGEVLWKCNVQRLSTLVELALVLLADIDAIGTVFTRYFQLRLLTLCVCELYSGDLASVLHARSNALPLFRAVGGACQLQRILGLGGTRTGDRTVWMGGVRQVLASVQSVLPDGGRVRLRLILW